MVVQTLAILLLLVANQAGGRRPNVAELPASLDVDPVLRPGLENMWRLSPTFRRQCRRLALAGLPVRLRAATRPSLSASHHAATSMTYTEASLTAARIDVPLLSPRLPELVAHEVEHIIEQLDGVMLHRLDATGDVWSTRNGAFETRRAIDVGRRVALEIETGGHAKDADGDPDTASVPIRSIRVSDNGRYLAFASSVPLVDADSNQLRDIYVFDLDTRVLTLESVGPAGEPADGDSDAPDVSRDGRFVVFASAAANLSGQPSMHGVPQIFLRDRRSGKVRLLSRNAGGMAANGPNGHPVISADGTTVVFESGARDLAGAPNQGAASMGIYLVRLDADDREPVVMARVSAPEGSQSVSPAVNSDGRFIAFMSRADESSRGLFAASPEPADGNGVSDVYLRDTWANTTTRLTRSHTGGDANGPSHHPAISGDGRYVAFASGASNLTPRVRRGTSQIYVHDRVTGLTELVTRAARGRGRGANADSRAPAISGDGRRIAFQSLASDLTCAMPCAQDVADTNLLWDVFLHDRTTDRTMRADGVTVRTGPDQSPSLDEHGRVLAFASGGEGGATDVETGDALLVPEGWRGRNADPQKTLPSPTSSGVADTVVPVETVASIHGARAQSRSEPLGRADSMANPYAGVTRREARALENAVALAALEPDVRVSVIEPDLAPDPEPLRHLDAFIVRELNGSLRTVIYVNRRSHILREAAGGSRLYVGVLAAVLHHEARHLAGASETEARRAELAFFHRLISLGQVPADLGRRYLQLLNQTADALAPPR